MTKEQAIASARRLAERRRIPVGPLSLVQLVDERSPLASSRPDWVRTHLGYWHVVFGSAHGGLDGQTEFWVNDATGRTTCPAAPWPREVSLALWVMVLPLYYVTIGIGLAGALLVTFIRRLRLPKCPVCRRRLRSAKAQQCFACGADWHQGGAPLR